MILTQDIFAHVKRYSERKVKYNEETEKMYNSFVKRYSERKVRCNACLVVAH